MPPKRFKPQVPMETRSRAKAKNNAEIQPEVDAKRIRKDSRPIPVEYGSALRNDYKGEVPAKPQNLYGEGPCNPPARGKADVPHDKSYVGEGPSKKDKDKGPPLSTVTPWWVASRAGCSPNSQQAGNTDKSTCLLGSSQTACAAAFCMGRVA
ncbi:hypothetical protein DdX_18844 [Ditylenchus destructor]|uniref:Uncharacterized protein n=1 Tax=Ditylenchus destructor TaxID=166010 RepID=A0AAD4QSL6_9BILA|nr:hypothetical protein DdX_18844 [Ditylenchus destructor]